MANKDMDQNPDAIPDFEPENDFSEFEDQESKDSVAGTMKKSPLMKIGIFAAGAIVIVGGLMLFGGSEEKAPDSRVTSGTELKDIPGTATLSPSMHEAMEEYNDQQREEALQKGTSVMPIPIEPPKTFMPVPADTAAAEDPLLRWRRMQEERLRVQREQEQIQQQANQGGGGQDSDPAVREATQNLAQAMMQNYSNLTSGSVPVRLTSMKITTPENRQQQQGMGAGGGLAGGAAAGAAGTLIPQEPLDILIPAGTILYGQLLNEANSDVNGPILGMLAQGQFTGSRIIGSFQRSEELLVMKFSTLVTKEGFSVPINTYAIDPDTTLIGMASEVDHRYWRRIILPAAAEFISGVGESIAKNSESSSVQIVGDVGSVSRTYDADLEESLAKGAEQAFDKVSEIVDEEGRDVPVLVIVKAGTPLGVMFMDAVTKQDVENARYGRRTGPQNQQQMGQQQQGQGMNPFFSLLNQQSNQNGFNQYGNTSGFNNQGNNQGFGGYQGYGNGNNDSQSSILQGLQNQQYLQTSTNQ